MGNNQYTGIHRGLVKQLSEEYRLKFLVETGTFSGESALWAESMGFVVHTVELSHNRRESLTDLFKDKPNIHFYSGNSAVVLEQILEKLEEPALIFLDAHYSPDSSSGQPIMDEIRMIKHCHVKHIIMIDDARLFGNGNWPIIQTVLEALRETGRFCYVFEDVIVGSYGTEGLKSAES